MLVCDKCKNRITTTSSKTNQTLIVYSAKAAYIGHSVDLCHDCIRSLEDFIGKAQSYFMTNENPSSLFDNNKYWNDN